MSAATVMEAGEYPKDGEPFYVAVPEVYRWLAYRPGSPQLKKGIKGRWQKHTGYGFENAELPEGLGWTDEGMSGLERQKRRAASQAHAPERQG